ncbi:hypothetical protein RJT34_12237 [Clitoria ternatea]|uniref:Cupin type-1 domain-containing protein n=1 Tax=Clitoria ternatea TaxID=43366 RepID=A0AAN9JPZ4_CLITE
MIIVIPVGLHGGLEARGEEVKQLRQVVEDKEEKIREMEVGMMEKNSEKEWELMGTKLLVEQMKEETTRRDEAVEKEVAGIVQLESEEKVVTIKKGDALALPFGVVTWWYNKEETELVVSFLGDTSKAHKAGEFINFFLTRSNGIFTGFSTEFVGRAWDLKEKDVKTLVGKQSGKDIVKLEGNITLPEAKQDHRNGMALNCEEAPLDVDIKGGGRVVVLNTQNLPLVGEVGLGADLVRLDGKAMCSPRFSCDSTLQVTLSGVMVGFRLLELMAEGFWRLL